MKKRILHVWNTAGVASVLAKFMDRWCSTQSWVITRSAFDPYGATTFGESLDSGSKTYTATVLLRARKYNLVHVHAFDRILSWLVRLYRNKPVVLHYHGSEIRGKWDERRKYWERADKILVSTPDLLENAPEETVWLPNPVDTDLFSPQSLTRKKQHAFHISYNADDLAAEMAQNNGIQLTIQNKQKTPIPHTELGKVLSSFEYYIDARRTKDDETQGELLPFISKTGLEALACGCKVIRWDGKILEGLPPQHHPQNVVKKLWNIYSSLFDK